MPRESREERYVREAMESSGTTPPEQVPPEQVPPEQTTPISQETQTEIAEPTKEDFLDAVNHLRNTDSGGALRVADWLEAGRIE